MGSQSLAKTVYDKGGVVLVTPLGTKLRMGSVGYFSGGQWIEVSTTRKMFGLPLTTSPGSAEPNSYDGQGGKGFKFEAKAKGQVSNLVPSLPNAKARAEISFGSDDGYVFNVRDQVVETALELADLMGAIRWAYRYRDQLPVQLGWQEKYAVVVGVASAASVTLVVARSSNAAVVVEGSGTLAAPATPAALDAKMKITKTEQSTERLWKGPATGFAVQALRLDASVFRAWYEEDLKYLRSFAAPADAPPSGMPLPKRPTSFEDWAKGAKVGRLVNSKGTIVRPSNRPGRELKVSDLEPPKRAARRK